MARTFAHYWLPAMAWAALVLLASSDTFSAQNTGSVLEAITGFLFGRLAPHTFDTLHFLIRKSAHLTEYGILSLLWFRAWRGPRGGFAWTWASLGVAVALATAITDEVHQSFVPSRGSSAWDVMLDLTGAVVVQIVVWLVIKRRRSSIPVSAPKEA